MCAGIAVLAFILYMILIKKLNPFNYEEKNALFACQKMQSKRMVDTEMEDSVGIVKDASVHLLGIINRINRSESLYGFDCGCVKDMQLIIFQA
jgi:hypothetical protein